MREGLLDFSCILRCCKDVAKCLAMGGVQIYVVKVDSCIPYVEYGRGEWKLVVNMVHFLPSFYCFSLKALVEGYKQWSSSAPNLGKIQRTAPAFPGFTSLAEMGKRIPWTLYSHLHFHSHLNEPLFSWPSPSTLQQCFHLGGIQFSFILCEITTFSFLVFFLFTFLLVPLICQGNKLLSVPL